jgi:hypothetical protein
MKKFFLFAITLLIVHFTLYIKNCEAQWVRIDNGIENKVISAFTSNNSTIFAGGQGGVYKSTNYGLNWIQTGLAERTVYALLSYDSNIFMGGDINGYYHSTNLGQNWAYHALDNSMTLNFAINGSTVYAETGYNIFYTTNNGQNWAQTTCIFRNTCSIAVDNLNLLEGTYDNGIFRSTNNGLNWTRILISSDIVYEIALNGANICAGTHFNGVKISTDYGQNWTNNLNNILVHTIKINGLYIYAGTTNGVYISNNSGQNWQQKNEGFNCNPGINKFLLLDNYIYASTSDVVTAVWRRPLSELIIGVNNNNSEIPSSYSLYQNYPNPFNPSTIIRYQITNNKHIILKIFDILGKEAVTLVNEKQSAGTYEATFDGTNLTSGIYFYSLYADGVKIDTKRMVLIK